MALSHSRARLRAQYALAHRYGKPASEIAAMRAELGRLARADAIREAVAADPPLTADEARSLVALIRAAAVT